MALFGGRRKEQERLREQEEQAELDRLQAELAAVDKQHHTELLDSLHSWFEAVKVHRPPGSTELTDEILAVVGPFPLPRMDSSDPDGRHQYYKDRGYLKGACRVLAIDYEAEAVAARRDDAPYWTSVRQYCEGVLGGF